MPATSVSIRLGVEGKAEIKRAFDEVGKAGQDAFRGVATSMDAAGTAADRQTQRLQRLAEAAKQAAAADQAQKSFNQVLGVGVGAPKSARESAEVFESAARAAEDLQARTAALRAQIDPLGAVGASGKLSSGQLVNLSYQLNDVVVSLAGGQRPLMVLMQQGSQIAQIFGPGAGVTGVLKGVWQGLTSLVTPTTAVVGGVLAIGAAVGSAYLRYVESQKELEAALAGTGRAAGVTVGAIELHRREFSFRRQRLGRRGARHYAERGRVPAATRIQRRALGRSAPARTYDRD